MLLKFIQQKGNKNKDFVMLYLDKSEIGSSREIRQLIGTVQPVLFTDRTNVQEAIKDLKNIEPKKILNV